MLKALIPGVQVTLTNAETKATYKVFSNEAGEYRLDVPAGIYALTTELCGFNAVKLSDIKVSENESTRLDPMTLTVHPRPDCNVSRSGIPIPLGPVAKEPPKRL